MRILPPVEEEIRRVVRDERAREPLITVSGLEHALEKHFDRGFSHQYVSKIADKVAREALIVADRTQIEERVNFTRENYRMMREELLKIVYWSPENAPDGSTKPRAQDRIKAAKNVVMMYLALLSAEIATACTRSPSTPSPKTSTTNPSPTKSAR